MSNIKPSNPPNPKASDIQHLIQIWDLHATHQELHDVKALLQVRQFLRPCPLLSDTAEECRQQQPRAATRHQHGAIACSQQGLESHVTSNHVCNTFMGLL